MHKNRFRSTCIPVLAALLAAASSTPVVAQDPMFQPEVSSLPITGSWIDATEDKHDCTGVSADTDVPGVGDFDLSLKDRVIDLVALEYSATFTIQRVRDGDAGLKVLDLSGVAEGLDETERVRALWFLKTNAKNEQLLTVVEWTESIQTGGQDHPELVLDPIPFSGTYVRCFDGPPKDSTAQ